MKPFHLYLYGPNRAPLEISFEEAEVRLRQLTMLHFEPDGSFVWTRDAGNQRVYGMIYDAKGSIQYCDLQGHCSYHAWEELCRAITGKRRDDLLVFMLPNQQLQDLQTFEEIHWPKREH